MPTAAIAQANATASPVANSTGSVTNQAIQMLTGPYATNRYSQGLQCQGPSLSISPFLTKSLTYADPFKSYTSTPYYDPTDEDENGVPDNPGKILYYSKMPSGQKNNHSWNYGISATISIPLDRKLQDQCKAAVDTETALQQQILANKRLDFEISRLKHCGTLAQQGIQFHPKSKFYVICSDVILTPVPNQNAKPIPHNHALKVSKPAAKSESQGSAPAAKPAVPKQIPVEPFSPASSRSGS